MERYKVDQKKQGEKAAREYLPQLFENKKEPMKQRKLEKVLQNHRGRQNGSFPVIRKVHFSTKTIS